MPAIQRMALVGIFSLCLLAFTDLSWAQSPSCEDPVLGSGACLPWGMTDLRYELPGEIVDLSKDGSVVIGEVGLTGIYRWKLGSGVSQVDLAGNATPMVTRPTVSANGAVVVGVHSPGAPLMSEVFRWDAESGTTAVDILPAGDTAAIQNIFPSRTDGEVVPTGGPSVSADGNTIVGFGRATDDVGAWITDSWVFRWTLTDGTTDAPQQPFTNQFIAWAVSGDGTTIVGSVSNVISGYYEAAVWTPGSGTQLGVSWSEATAVSYDGSVAAGYRSGVPGPGFTWTQGVGTTDFSYDALPRSMSDDGSVIAWLNFEPPSPPFVAWEPWVSDPFEDRQMPDYLSYQYGLSGFNYSLFLDPLGLVSGNGDVYSMVGAKWVAKVTPISAVALGDSFSSGEGVPDFLPGTDDSDNKCRRSVKAYSTLYHPRSSYYTMYELSTYHLFYEWQFAACSGALTDHVRSTPDNQNTPPQYASSGTVGGVNQGVRQLEQVFVNDETDLVTITIGGNDALFKKVVIFCAKNYNCQDESFHGSAKPLKGYLSDHIRDTVSTALENTFEQTRLKAPNATVIVLGYPMLFGLETCGIIWNKNELLFFQEVGKLLNLVIAEAAKKEGVHFVPVARQFDRHGYCDVEQSWINHPYNVFNLHYGMHPNAKGQKAYAGAVTKFLQDAGINHAYGFFESGLPKNPPVP